MRRSRSRLAPAALLILAVSLPAVAADDARPRAPGDRVIDLLRATRATLKPDDASGRGAAGQRRMARRATDPAAVRPRTSRPSSLVLWSRLHGTETNREVVDALQGLYDPRPDPEARARRWSLVHVGDQLAAGTLFAGCECFCNADCSDGVFCNGAEVCSGGRCFAGSPPTCNDADACTTDTCDGGTDTCVHSPVDPPQEVTNLSLNHPDPALTQSVLTWDTLPGAARYNIYRAMVPELTDLSCFATVPVPPGSDADPLSPGQLKLYLVTAVACGESTLGTDSVNRERVNGVPCPP